MTTRRTTRRAARFRAPVIMLIGGQACAAAVLAGERARGPWPAVGQVEIVTVVAALLYYFLGGRDSDVGALFGSRPDERQAAIRTRARSLTAGVMLLCGMGGVLLGVVLNDTAVLVSFAVVTAVGVATFVIGLLIFRADPDMEHPE